MSVVAGSLWLISARADDRLEHRTGYIDCGSAQVRALAECYEHSAACVTETLSFSRRGGRLIVPLHTRYTEHSVSVAR